MLFKLYEIKATDALPLGIRRYKLPRCKSINQRNKRYPARRRFRSIVCKWKS
jgi:hypothetical protein